MRTPPVQQKHGSYTQKLVGGGSVVIAKNSRTVLDDELPAGEWRYDQATNTFTHGPSLAWPRPLVLT